MKKNIAYPKIVLIGRTNVGKSALFNRLSDKKSSIVFDRDGVTRDHIHEVITWNDKTFDLIDTGGFPPSARGDSIDSLVHKAVNDQLKMADVVLFVVDGKNGLVSLDQVIAKTIHRTKKPVLLLVNKSDVTSTYKENFSEFYALGFEDMLSISALHGRGIASVLDMATDLIKDTPQEKLESDYNVVLLGKPNVGKSSLMNRLLKEERSIVSSVPGTTREALSEQLAFSTASIKLTDTAGVRRKRGVKDDLEGLMVKSSLSSVRNADIVAILIDASEKVLCDQELKLLFYAYEQKKCVVLVFNKIDLLSNDDRDSLKHNLSQYDFILKKIPQVWISCKDGNVTPVLRAIHKVWERSIQEFSDYELSDTVHSRLEGIPLYRNKVPLRIGKLKQIKGSVATFAVYARHPELFSDSHRGCIENILRDSYDLKGCPVTISLRKFTFK